MTQAGLPRPDKVLLVSAVKGTGVRELIEEVKAGLGFRRDTVHFDLCWVFSCGGDINDFVPKHITEFHTARALFSYALSSHAYVSAGATCGWSVPRTRARAPSSVL